MSDTLRQKAEEKLKEHTAGLLRPRLREMVIDAMLDFHKEASASDTFTKEQVKELQLHCNLDEQQCRDSCDHKDDRTKCPHVTIEYPTSEVTN